MKSLINMYEELKETISLDDIDYIVCSANRWSAPTVFSIPIPWFLEAIKRIDYDPGYGGAVINLGLKIVLKNGSWLERSEYDGSESWQLNKKPYLPEDQSFNNDIACLFEENHKCPYNETKVDGVNINNRALRFKDGYYIWLEKDGKIEIEFHEWVDGNYKPEHQNLLP